MSSGAFLIVGLVGLVLLAFSALTGGEDVDIDPDIDLDVDVDTDADFDSPQGGGGILQWLSIKALSVAAVGFGFTGWALTLSDRATPVVWIVSILVGVAVWTLAVLLLFPWIRKQLGHDLQTVSVFEGITAEVVVRIPPNGLGTVQFRHPNGAVIRSEARAADHEELAVGKKVLIVLANPEFVVVDEFPFWDDPS